MCEVMTVFVTPPAPPPGPARNPAWHREWGCKEPTCARGVLHGVARSSSRCPAWRRRPAARQQQARRLRAGALPNGACTAVRCGVHVAALLGQPLRRSWPAQKTPHACSPRVVRGGVLREPGSPARRMYRVGVCSVWHAGRRGARRCGAVHAGGGTLRVVWLSAAPAVASLVSQRFTIIGRGGGPCRVQHHDDACQCAGGAAPTRPGLTSQPRRPTIALEEAGKGWESS